MNTTKRTIIIALLALGPTAAYAGQVNNAYMTSFTAGTPAVASEVNQNFDELTQQINENDSRISTNNGNITANTSNISSNTAAIAGKQDAAMFGENFAPLVLASLSDFYRIGTSTITPSKSGTCLVTGVAQLYFDPTDSGTVGFQLASLDSLGTTVNDTQYASVLSAATGATPPVTQSRSAVFSVTGGETYSFGCLFTGRDASYADNYISCSVSYSCF